MKATHHISFEELANNVTDVFNRVRAAHKAVVVESANGEKFLIKPLSAAKTHRRRSSKRTKADYEAFLAAAGSWHDVDTDELIKRIYTSRTISTRPPVDL